MGRDCQEELPKAHLLDDFHIVNATHISPWDGNVSSTTLAWAPPPKPWRCNTTPHENLQLCSPKSSHSKPRSKHSHVVTQSMAGSSTEWNRCLTLSTHTSFGRCRTTLRSAYTPPPAWRGSGNAEVGSLISAVSLQYQHLVHFTPPALIVPPRARPIPRPGPPPPDSVVGQA